MRGMRLAALALAVVVGLASCASGVFVPAEECYSIGLAYYEKKNFAEAEKWLEKARRVDKTRTASRYQMGRIAFEQGQYARAAGFFRGILEEDRENVMALRALAYTYIKMGDAERAEEYYAKVVERSPESADDGYNWALVLRALGKDAEAEAALERYAYNLPNNKEAQLLLARLQKEQDKPEAIDSYALYLTFDDKNTAVRYEYAQLLEAHAFYARASEEYEKVLKALKDGGTPSKAEVAFAKARVTLAAYPVSIDGISAFPQTVREALQFALDSGFKDTEALDALLEAEDSEHVMEMRALAYVYGKLGDKEKAAKYYGMVVEHTQAGKASVADGLDWALALQALGETAQAEAALARYTFKMPEDKEAQLLLARLQKAQAESGAVDSYALYLKQEAGDTAARYEYAQALEKNSLYERALKEYETVLKELTAEVSAAEDGAKDSAEKKDGAKTDTAKTDGAKKDGAKKEAEAAEAKLPPARMPTEAEALFAKARLLLSAYPKRADGLKTFRQALEGGFMDVAALKELLEVPELSEEAKAAVEEAVNSMAGGR